MEENINRNQLDYEDDKEFLFWEVGTSPPQGFPQNAFLSCLVPRPVAWICLYENENVRVALLEGYNGASDRPPTIMFASAALPPSLLTCLRSSGICSLSVTTVRDQEALNRYNLLQKQTAPESGYSLEELGLEAQNAPHTLLSYDSTNSPEKKIQRPPAIRASPIHMHCRLVMDVELTPPGSSDSNNNNKESIIMLEIEHFFIRGDVLRKQSSVPQQTKIYTHDNPDVRKITAKIEADLVKPVCSLGNGNFGQLEDGVYHMRRPVFQHSNDKYTKSSWVVDTFQKMAPITATPDKFCTNVEFNYRNEPYCTLGYNPMKQIVAPRPIGWLSSYAKEDRKISHVSPYSFFIDVGRGVETSMVAFIACHREDDQDENGKQQNAIENNDRSLLKDAHRDAEEMGAFSWNLVSKDLAEEMNYSAAELERHESEFDGGPLLRSIQQSTAKTIDAPIVKASHCIFECQYVTTLLVPRSKPKVERQWFCIVGRVNAIHIRKTLLIEQTTLRRDESIKKAQVLDILQLQPIARLGYEQEYGVIVPFNI